jgi:hypothetical protein
MSGGVFEVSLVKVVESRGTIEVVWDSGYVTLERIFIIV